MNNEQLTLIAQQMGATVAALLKTTINPLLKVVGPEYVKTLEPVFDRLDAAVAAKMGIAGKLILAQTEASKKLLYALGEEFVSDEFADVLGNTIASGIVAVSTIKKAGESIGEDPQSVALIETIEAQFDAINNYFTDKGEEQSDPDERTPMEKAHEAMYGTGEGAADLEATLRQQTGEMI
jgi:hypothetical protein